LTYQSLLVELVLPLMAVYQEMEPIDVLVEWLDLQRLREHFDYEDEEELNSVLQINKTESVASSSRKPTAATGQLRRRKGEKRLRDNENVRRWKAYAKVLSRNDRKLAFLKDAFEKQKDPRRRSRCMADIARRLVYNGEVHDHGNFSRWIIKRQAGGTTNTILLVSWFETYFPATLNQVLFNNF